jgi:hypothetical protein
MSKLDGIQTVTDRHFQKKIFLLLANSMENVSRFAFAFQVPILKVQMRPAYYFCRSI